MIKKNTLHSYQQICDIFSIDNTKVKVQTMIYKKTTQKTKDRATRISQTKCELKSSGKISSSCSTSHWHSLLW